jgi:hypothetical protein
MFPEPLEVLDLDSIFSSIHEYLQIWFGKKPEFFLRHWEKLDWPNSFSALREKASLASTESFLQLLDGTLFGISIFPGR